MANKKNKNLIECILVILILAFIFFLVYSPHLNYFLPFHIDEWHHMTEARKIMDSNYQITQSSYKIGFHLLLAPISLLPFIFWQYFPAIIATISALILFLFVNKYYGFYQGIFSMIFFSSLKSNVHLLGLWFLTPLALSFIFYFALIFIFYKAIKEDSVRYFLLFIFISTLVSFFYILTLFSLIPALTLWIIFKWKSIKKIRKYIYICIIPGISGIILYYIINKNIYSLFSNLIFDSTFAVVEKTNSLFSVYSIIGFIFAIIGIFFIKNKFLILLLMTQSAHLAFFELTNFSPLIPYQRLLYYFSATLCIFSSIGTYEIIKKFKYGWLVIFLIPLAFFGYSTPEYNFSLYQPVEINILPLYDSLKEMPEGIVIVDPFNAVGLYLLSNKEPFATPYFYNRHLSNIARHFAYFECEEQRNIVKKYNISYIIKEEYSDCFNLILNKNGYYLYEKD